MYRLTFAALYSAAYEGYTVGASNRTGGVYCSRSDTTHFLVTDSTRTYAAFALEDATPPAPWQVSIAQNASAANLTLIPGAPAAPQPAALRAALDPLLPALNLTAMLLFVDTLEPLSEGAPTPPARAAALALRLPPQPARSASPAIWLCARQQAARPAPAEALRRPAAQASWCRPRSSPTAGTRSASAPPAGARASGAATLSS